MISPEYLIKKAKRGDEEAFEVLIKNNSPLIWSIVKRYLGRGADSDDLYQLGCLGLLKAIRSFDETLGYQFSTYAVPKISGEIRRFLRDDGAIKVSRTLKERAARIRYTASTLQNSLDREPSISEIAEMLGLTIEEVAEAECATACTDSLNREVNEDGQTLEDLLGNHGIEDYTLERISLSEAIETLPEKERSVIFLRFFHSTTQTQAAKVLGISQVQVSRIERSALKKLREKLE